MTRPTHRSGFTLIELLIAMVVLGIVMGAALTMMRSQSTNFRKGGTRMEVVQNMRYAMSTIDRVLRTTGAGVGTNQPMFVYGSNDVVLFNTNYATIIPDGTALYTNPDLPAGAVGSMLNNAQLTIPGTAILYPDSNYFWGGVTPSNAETMMFFFRPDSTTAADPNDFLLLQQINNLAPEQVARNIYPYPGRPFFEFWYDSSTAAGTVVSTQLQAARIPFRHTAGWHGSPGDSAGSALADSIRMVRVNFTVTNADAQDSTSRMVSTIIGTPNNGLVLIKTCGDQPICTSGVSATPNVVGT
ncbi:MAG: PilW family protein, partial [Gemmatimonadales bacterium]